MKLPWIRLFVGDFIADTSHLTTTQFGAYVRLVFHYYQRGGLPVDEEQLSRIAGLAATEWRRHRPALSAFFKDEWRHMRCDREIADAAANHERRSRASQIAHAARWGHANRMPIACQPQPQPQSQKEEP